MPLIALACPEESITKAMESDDRIQQILVEIRDGQREQIEEYRRVANHALELQKTAVSRQESLGRLYKGALVVGGIMVVVIVIIIVYLLGILFQYT